MQHKVAKGLLSLKTQQTSMRHQDVCLHPKNPSQTLSSQNSWEIEKLAWGLTRIFPFHSLLFWRFFCNIKFTAYLIIFWKYSNINHT